MVKRDGRRSDPHRARRHHQARSQREVARSGFVSAPAVCARWACAPGPAARPPLAAFRPHVSAPSCPTVSGDAPHSGDFSCHLCNATQARACAQLADRCWFFPRCSAGAFARRQPRGRFASSLLHWRARGRLKSLLLRRCAADSPATASARSHTSLGGFLAPERAQNELARACTGQRSVTPPRRECSCTAKAPLTARHPARLRPATAALLV